MDTGRRMSSATPSTPICRFTAIAGRRPLRVCVKFGVCVRRGRNRGYGSSNVLGYAEHADMPFHGNRRRRPLQSREIFAAVFVGTALCHTGRRGRRPLQ